MHKSEIGRIGEKIACEFLKKKKYAIIERNYLKPWGELDIVARQRDGTLVFVEVKTLQLGSGQAPEGGDLKPEDNLTDAKLKKLKRTAALYAGQNQKLVSDKTGWRIDLIAILLNDLTNPSNNCDIRHYENIA